MVSGTPRYTRVTMVQMATLYVAKCTNKGRPAPAVARGRLVQPSILDFVRPLDQIRPQWNHPYHQHPGNNPRSNLCSQKYNLQKQPKLHSEISKWHPKQMCPSLPHKHQYQGLPRDLQQEGRQREEEPHQDELSPPPSPRLSSSPTMTWRLTSKL